MAEGDSIARLAIRLDRQLAGTTATDCRFLTGRLAGTDVTGRRVEGVASVGKHLLVRFGPAGGGAPVTLHVHLRMDGRLQVVPTSSVGPGDRYGSLRFAVAFGERALAGLDVPHACLLATADEQREVGHLGPDLCSPGWDGAWAARAVRRLSRDPDRPVIHALLDQRNLAGIGNLWAVEGCFLRGLYPWTPVGDVADLAAVVDLEHRMLAQGVRTGLMVTTGDRRRGRTHWVYGRSGRPCLRCATPISFRPADGTGEQRETWWCPTCQPPV